MPIEWMSYYFCKKSEVCFVLKRPMYPIKQRIQFYSNLPLLCL
jgi:hypothetical protein